MSDEISDKVIEAIGIGLLYVVLSPLLICGLIVEGLVAGMSWAITTERSQK